MTPRRLVALALARAALAGPAAPAGVAACWQACLGKRGEWQRTLADRLVDRVAHRWAHVEVIELAAWIDANPLLDLAWAGGEPTIRRHLLRPRSTLQPPPLGLEHVPQPHWPTVGDLAAWLDLSAGALWRLTLPAAWQRRQTLAQQHYTFHWRAKAQGGARLIEAPLPHLKALQRRLLDAMLAHVPPHEAACGFTRGRSVVDHAARHAGQAVVLRFDLRNYFASVRASRVHALWRTLGYPMEVARALTALTTLATPQPVLARGREAHRLPWGATQPLRDAHLPQGAPTSPALANLAAFGLDLRLAGLAETLAATYSRYADDLVLSGDRSLLAVRERVCTRVAVIAREEGFALNHRKTRCCTAGQSQRIAGMVVNARPNLPRGEYDRLKAALHRRVRDGGCLAERDRLRGHVAWAMQVNPQRAQRLQRLFEAIVWSP
jgi:RNA-directed DNA polymerase